MELQKALLNAKEMDLRFVEQSTVQKEIIFRLQLYVTDLWHGKTVCNIMRLFWLKWDMLHLHLIFVAVLLCVEKVTEKPQRCLF